VSLTYAAATFGRLAFTLLAIDCFSRGSSRRALFFWIMAVPAELTWTVMVGEKKQVVYILLTLVFLFHYLRRRLALGAPLILIGVTLIVVFPLINAYRQGSAPAILERLPLHDIGRQTLEELSAGPPSDGVVDQAASIMWRFPGIDSLATIMKVVPATVDFQWGRTIVNKVAVFVPAAIMVDKQDVIKQGWIFNRGWFGNDVHSDSPLTQIGELYANFWVPGVIVGLFLFGVFYRATYLLFARGSGSLKYVVYVPLWFGIMNIESDIGLIGANIARQFLISFAVYWVMGKLQGTRRRHPSRSGAL